MTTPNNDFEAAIAAARAQHERNAKLKPRYTFASVSRVSGGYEPMFDDMAQKRIKESVDAIHDAFSDEDYARNIYAPHLAKIAMIRVCELIADVFRDSKVKQMRAITSQIDQYAKTFREELASSQYPQFAGDCIQSMGERWLDDVAITIIGNQKRAYANHLTKFSENAADLLGYIFALRDLCTATIAFDTNMAHRLNEICNTKNFYYVNTKDVSHVMRKHLEDISVAMCGITDMPDSATIRKGRKAFAKAIETADIVFYLREWVSQQNCKDNGTPCDALRCQCCKHYPCAVFKDSRKVVYANIKGK